LHNGVSCHYAMLSGKTMSSNDARHPQNDHNRLSWSDNRLPNVPPREL
jgi:hypothetical protein